MNSLQLDRAECTCLCMSNTVELLGILDGREIFQLVNGLMDYKELAKQPVSLGDFIKLYLKIRQWVYFQI